MRLLYLCYWGIDEGLTKATVLPHLNILAAFPEVESIQFVTVERGKFGNPSNLPEKVHYHPFESKKFGIHLLTKIMDMERLLGHCRRIVNEQQVNFFLGRTALAGVIGWRLFVTKQIPYAVESFEPHADYMLEAGVWKKWDPRYLFQRWWEKKQKQTASLLMPVAENYRQQLIREGVPQQKIVTVPCCVDIDKFRFDQSDRDEVRSLLSIPSASRVGVYVGKFGGIYMDEEAFDLFRSCFEQRDDFQLIILTPQIAEVKEKALKANLPEGRVHIESVPHEEVTKYLSAADFAFSLHRPTDSSKYLSPIKNGEYWANGLPILLSDGIGDDSEIIRNSTGGLLMEIGIETWLQKVLASLKRDFIKESHEDLLDMRSFELVKISYRTLISNYTDAVQ